MQLMIQPCALINGWSCTRYFHTHTHGEFVWLHPRQTERVQRVADFDQNLEVQVEIKLVTT
jgi:hypothetical protein